MNYLDYKKQLEEDRKSIKALTDQQLIIEMEHTFQAEVEDMCWDSGISNEEMFKMLIEELKSRLIGR